MKNAKERGTRNALRRCPPLTFNDLSCYRILILSALRDVALEEELLM